ncbi:MAG TPA: penicillin-binding transpeptidase domain-containing protein, partial [Acidobacteriaceae bacterium]
GIKRVIAVARRFGITSDMPAFLPVAIGAADLTLAEQVGGYSVFPNDGILIVPHTIRRVTRFDGSPLEQPRPQVSEAIPMGIAREMMVLLEAVVQHGTGVAAAQLHHALGGKTGTTNNFTDAWFLGFSPSVTCGTWVGFDNRQSLGEKETGARAALPIWIDFMKVAIADKPNEVFAHPNAPKREIDVATEPAVDAIPVAPQPREGDQAEPDDAGTDVPAENPASLPVGPSTLPEDVGTRDSASAAFVRDVPKAGAVATPAKPLKPGTHPVRKMPLKPANKKAVIDFTKPHY